MSANINPILPCEENEVVKIALTTLQEASLNNDFIPMVKLDKTYTENGFKYTDSSQKVSLSPYIEERNYILESVMFDNSDEFVLRFEIGKGNSLANDNRGSIHAIGRGVKIVSQTEFTIKYSQKILLRISKKEIKSGAYIDFYANDDDWMFYSIANVHCGRVRIGGTSPTSFDKTITASEKELYINAILPRDRSCEGAMIIFDKSSVIYKCYTMGRGSNRKRLIAQGNGDTPTGKCSTQYGRRHIGNSSFGNHGLIYLTGISGEFLNATQNGRSGIAIHAGHTIGYRNQITDKGCLMSTYGCLRVYNADIERIVKIYNKYKDEGYKIYCYIEDVSEISFVFPHYEMIPDPKDNRRTTDSKTQ